MVSYRERAEHAWTEDSVRLIMTPSEFAKTALYYVQELIELHHGKSIRNELLASKVIVVLLTELILTGSYSDTVPAEMPPYIAAALAIDRKKVR
jgi:hypothetical protein